MPATCRARGHEVLFLCATDEHGTPPNWPPPRRASRWRSIVPRCGRFRKDLADGFRLSFDKYGRSSSPQNHALTQHFAGRLAEAGLIDEVVEKQVYSNADGRFLPDRYIEGTCPNCGYDKARGDQCENCTKQLDPTDLIEPRSAISGSTDLEVRETKHLYLKQRSLRGKLSGLDRQQDRLADPDDLDCEEMAERRRRFAGSGDHPRPGLGHSGEEGQEPWPGMEGKVFYVWFDAPIEYIACAKEWSDGRGAPDAEWERWWRTDKGAEDVKYVQFMGKDNVPFHTLSFPPRSSARARTWKLVDYIKSFNYLNYDGGQFSTSQGRGVFMDQALEILPADYWRWWLLSHAPESSDSEFTWENFQASGEQGSGRCPGQFRQPGDQVLPFQVRRRGAGGWRLGAGGRGFDRQAGRGA